MVDYYEILEISKDASENDIKKAYRKQALKWHPDKNPDNKEEAEAKFKSISEAYEVLSDKEKRSVYDRYGKEGLSNGGGGGFGSGTGAGFHFTFHDPNEIFREFFGGRDPFANMFSGGARSGGFADPFGPGFGSMGVGFSSFNSTFTDFPDFGGGSSSFTFSSSSGGGSGRSNKKSVTKTVKQVNGQKIETKKIVENGNERVEIRKNGKITSVKINGVFDDEQFAIEQSKDEMESGNNQVHNISSFNFSSSRNTGFDDQDFNNYDMQKAMEDSYQDAYTKPKKDESSKHKSSKGFKFW